MARTRFFCCVLIWVLLLSGGVFAQGTTSNLTGEVRMDGAPFPGVTVTISSPQLQGKRTAMTDVNGIYNIPALPPGNYSVTFEMEGMATVTKTTKISLAKTERVDATMKLSAVAEAITVTAAAPAVLETTEVTANIDAKTVENLPVGRRLQDTVQLAPGVTQTGVGNAPIVGGGYAYDTLYLINGAVSNENIRGQTSNLYIEDAIQETSIMTGSISAEYGRFTGGVVSAITKSGGNEFSGSLRDSLTNAAWDETSPLDEPQQDSVVDNTYEATLGGRVLRDRLWFFAAGRSLKQNLAKFYADSSIPEPTQGSDEKRWEAKLTGQITPKHSLVASYLDLKSTDTNYCPNWGCFELSAVDPQRQTPQFMKTAHYNGIFTSNLLVEGAYSARSLKFVGGGGDYITKNPNDPRDLALGTAAFDNYDTGSGWASPVWCGTCKPKSRTNQYYEAKATYYLSTSAAGTHNLVAGYENFAESRDEDNYQSGSNFLVYTYGVVPERESDGTLRPIIVAGDDIVYTPVPIVSKGSDFVTQSVFVNDKWDLGAKWSFNVGVRYDKNDGKDSSGNPISKDSNVSPRLGVIYDLLGDHRFRVNASYSKYVSRIQESVGGAGGGGNPWYIHYTYDGDQIGGVGTGMDSYAVLENLFTWFLDQGGLGASDLISSASVPGFNTRFTGDLKSPSVDEWTVGFGTQIGTKGMFRADYIDRSWANFYVLATSPHDQVEGPWPLPPGTFLDVETTRNAISSDHLKRSYNSVQMQASYRFSNRFNLAGNYTWSEAKGNSVGETSGLGPIADPAGSYVEYRAFDRYNPVGFLPSDQTHKFRLWATYDLPIGVAGKLNFSVLERFDSGTPYSAVANVNPRAYVTNPGYASRPSGVSYYFSDRGAYRWDNATATDVAVNYELPLGLRKTQIFVQGEVINVFNESAQIAGNVSVRVIKAFDPFHETPVEGVNWVKGANFGKATTPAHYQQPLTYRASVGFRF